MLKERKEKLEALKAGKGKNQKKNETLVSEIVFVEVERGGHLRSTFQPGRAHLGLLLGEAPSKQGPSVYRRPVHRRDRRRGCRARVGRGDRRVPPGRIPWKQPPQHLTSDADLRSGPRRDSRHDDPGYDPARGRRRRLL